MADALIRYNSGPVRVVRFLQDLWAYAMKWEMWGLIAGTAALVAGCLIPNRLLPRLPNDKLMHAGAFAVLAWLALGVASGPRSAVAWMAGLAIAGWLIECLQRLVPDRGFSWADIGANLAGIGAAILIRCVTP